MTTLEPAARHRGRPALNRDTPLTRDEILDRALEIVQTQGRDSLSMRALARELGVTPMALYHYVADKRELLAALVERVWQQTGSQAPPFGDDPVEGLVAILVSMRRIWLEHFDLATLAVTVFDADDVLFGTTVGLTAMCEAIGFPNVPLAYSAVQNLTIGCVQITANRRAASVFFGRDPDAILAKARRLFSRRRATANQLGVLEARFDEGDERHFEASLRALIAGLMANRT